MGSPGRHSYARRRRSTGRVVGALVLLVVVVAAIATAVTLVPSWLRSSPSTVTPTSAPSVSSCPTADLPGSARLGTFAWVEGGALRLIDLGSCEERTLVPTDAAPPVRFSFDGKWLAFGEGSIVSTQGGDVSTPLGRTSAWQWSPAADTLAGVTPGGGVVIGGPDTARRVLLRDGTGAEHLAISPSGRTLAVDVGGDRIEVVRVRGGRTVTIYQVSPGTKAPPEIAGWSPDGRWVLFFSRFRGQVGVPLNAVPARGGDWVNVFEPVLPYQDFLAWCGSELALAGGADQQPSEGNQILVSGPPAWRFHNVSADFGRSYFWPACSPNGRWVAATGSPSRPETPPGRGARALWLLSVDGSKRTRLSQTTKAAYELPRWSADGRYLLVVRRGVEPAAPGVLVLIPIDPSSGKTGKPVGPLARLGPAPGQRGRNAWSEMSDWFRPG